MADIPKYERTTPIQSQQAVQGFGEAAGKFGAYAEAIGQIGATFAQQSANRYARLQGAEAAQRDIRDNKVRDLIPLTEADKHYAESYTQHHLADLASEGQKTLDAFYQTAAKTPTGESLSDYEQYSKQAIDQIIEKTGREHKQNLRRSLEDAYYSGFLKLSSQVNAKNNEYLRSKQVTESGEKLENITNRALQGSYQAAKDALNDSLQDTANREADFKLSGGEIGYSPQQAKTARELAEDRFRVAVMSHKWEQAQKEGKGDKFIEDLRTNPPEGLSPIQQANLVKGTMAYAQEYKSALKGQQTINYVNALTAVDAGQMTDAALIQAQRDLSEPDYAKLQNYIGKKQAANSLKEAEIAAFIDNKDNGVALAGMSGKVADAAYQRLIKQREEQTGETASLEAAAEIARGIKAKVPLFNEQMDAAIRSQNPETSIRASQAYRSLAKLNPISVEGVGAKAKGIAEQMTSAIRRGVPSQEAYATAMRNAQDVDTKTRDDRASQLKRKLDSMSAWKNETVQEKAIANIMGYQREYMPIGVQSDFMDEVKNAYTNSPDMALEDAFDIAKATLERMYGPYNGRIMYLPPTLGYGVSEIAAQNCFIETLQQLTDNMKDKENLASKYEIDSDYIIPAKENFDINDFSRLSKNSLARSAFNQAARENRTQMAINEIYGIGNSYIGDIPGKRIDRQGNVIKGVFSFRPDEYTDSIPPSYSIMFLPEGKRIPDMVPSADDTYRGARFSITEDQLRRSAYEISQKEERKEAQMKPLIERQAQIEALREKYGEPDIEF